jgi:flagellar hook assembly protein FlgD
MRRTAYQTLVAVIATTLVATTLGFVAVAPVRAAAGAPAKVVIIVGPTGSATASYIEDAMAAADAARQWTSDVVELYSPDATWDRVSAALQGASIVVYMGHGNGFPNPRAKAFDGAAQNGMGLNPPGGGATAPTAYYGENVIAAQVRLAPSAVVILAHLCYAAGSSEPGFPDPTPAIARQRADGFAAGWLKAGARAVVADAWFGSAATMIDGLFSTSGQVADLWSSAPSSNHAEDAAPSTRTPGATLTLDPSGPTYWRALSVFPGLTAADVVGGRVSDTASDPSTIQAPGAAEVGSAGAELYTANAASPAAVLAPGMRLRVLRSTGKAKSGPLAGRATVEIRPIDGGPTGRVAVDVLLPRDSRAPIAYLVEGTGSALTLRGAGEAGPVAISGRLSEPATWTATISAADGATIASSGGSGDAFSVTWDGTADGSPAPEGSYDLTIVATDAWGNAGTALSRRIVVDRTPPALTAKLPAAPAVVSPNGDGIADTLRTPFTVTEAATLAISVRDAAANVVDAGEVATGSGASAVIWDGRGPAGVPLPDGAYTYEIVPRDAAGNVGRALVRQVVVATMLAAVKSTAAVFDPTTPGAARSATAFAFTLARPASVTVTVADPAGHLVRTLASATPLGAGPQSVPWDATSDAGAQVPPGTYTATITASDGLGTAMQAVVVGVGPFRVAVSPATATRGKVLVITIWTALPLTAPPTLRVTQPGVGAWDATLTPINASTWRLRTTVPTGGRAGTLSVRVAGAAPGGATATYAVAVPLR